MKTKTILIIALLSLGFTTQAAKVPKAVTILAKLNEMNSLRLDANGVIIQDDNLTAQFNDEQNRAILLLKKYNYIGHSFTITNSIKTDVVMTVSTIEEKDGTVAGALVESSYYKDTTAEAIPRAVGLDTLRSGMDAMVYNGQSVARIVAESVLSPKSGGLLTVFYPTDFNSGGYDKVKINLLKSTDGHFAFYQEDRSTFTSVHIDLWVKIFSRNFGVNSLTFE
jgi:hypothetical protein